MSPKTKNIYVIGGFIVLLIISYKFAIANTICEYRLYSKTKKEQLLFNNIPKELAGLNQKKQFYDSILNTYQLKGSSFQNNLVRTINLFSKEKGIKIVNFLEPHLQQKEDIQIKTYQFTLEGDFKSINQFIYQLEQHSKFGEIISIQFKKLKDFRKGRFYLQAKILLKSFS